MKRILLVLMMLAGSSMLFAKTRVFVGVGIGHGGFYAGYYQAPPPYAYMPPCPGPGYSWVPGYRVRVGPRVRWYDGYWAPPAYGYGYSWRPRHHRDWDDWRWRRHGHGRNHERWERDYRR